MLWAVSLSKKIPIRITSYNVCYTKLLRSKDVSEYSGVNSDADLLYAGSPENWQKLANSLMLRYYMRISEKLPSYAKEGIEEIVANPSEYPIFTSNDDDAAMRNNFV